jgi:leucyl-tRNA synthetase
VGILTINWEEIQKKWHSKWNDVNVYETNPISTKDKYFLTVAYPYPNSPQHIGHGRTYTLTDVYARFLRMKGFNVLFPMAFHYTGTPILAMSKRLIEKDKELLDAFVNVYGIPPDDISQFEKPLNIAQYFHNEIKNGMVEMGYSIDWRREFTTIDPEYKKFIEWQFKKLNDREYITRGSHPVGWCPNDGNPVGQHDTLGDVEPDLGEYVMIHFKFGDYFMPTATLRPETIFGVTNIWINPDVMYSKVRFNNDKWILSNEAVIKFKHLGYEIEIEEEELGANFIGKMAANPVNDDDVAILPADFVNPKNGTGIVMSVPAHAPYDLQALRDLQKNKPLVDGINVNSINSIQVIEIERYNGIPSETILKEMNIESQNDPKLEAATKELYTKEFNEGKMKMTGPYYGLPVKIAKDKVRDDLIASDQASILYEIMNSPVICRCGTECVVKLFENQWFINYGNEDWKEIVHTHMSSMTLLPNEIRNEFENTVDWMREKACARKSGLGTDLPWDKNWVIESLSDSVIYMAFYTISHLLKKYNLPASNLNEYFFDFIFLGKGNVKNVSEKCNINVETLDILRNEFLYFYPLDSRHPGRDLVPNHLTFFVFNHLAIFQKDLWPKQIVVNGSVLMDGKKMSKSFGNIIPLRKAISEHGADPIRLGILATAELLQDADFTISLVTTFNERLNKLYNLACKVEQANEINYDGITSIDEWFLSRIQRNIINATNSMEKLRLREAIHTIIYIFDQDTQWYVRRTMNDYNPSIMKHVLKIRIKLLSPFAPFVCEELWEKLGSGELIVKETWPVIDNDLLSPKSEELESLLIQILNDINKITKVTKIKPNAIYLYTSSKWKWDIYLQILDLIKNNSFDMKSLLSEKFQDDSLKSNAKVVSDYVQKSYIDLKNTSSDIIINKLKIGALDEYVFLQSSISFLENELKTKIIIFNEDDEQKFDPKNKAHFAKPSRPAIYIE